MLTIAAFLYIYFTYRYRDYGVKKIKVGYHPMSFWDQKNFMICYRDTTFCVSPNCKNECGRQLTDEICEDACKWWGSDDAPIAMSTFCCDTDLSEAIALRFPKES